MILALTILIFLTVVAVVFSFAAAGLAPSSVLGSRLREIGWQRPKDAEQKTPIRERIQQALNPLSKALPVSPTDVSQTRAWLIQAGYRDPQHVSIFSEHGSCFAIIGLSAVVAFTGFDSLLLFGRNSGARVFYSPVFSEADDAAADRCAFASACPTRSTSP